MTDKQPESGQSQGVAGLPAPQTSGEPGAQPTSVDVEALVAALESNPKFQDYIDRRFQSVKDKRINKIEKTQDDFRGKLERVQNWMSKGKSQDEALLLIDVEDELLARRSQPEQAQSAPARQAGNQPPAPIADYDVTLRALDLRSDDPAVTDIIRSGGDIERNLLNLKAQRISKPAAPANPAQVMTPGSGAHANTDIEAEYQNKLKQVRRGDTRAITALQQEYRKKAREAGVTFNH